MDVDKYLSRFRSAAPPGELRARVLAASRHPVRRRWPAGIAALIVAALVGFNLMLEARLERLLRSSPAALDAGAASGPVGDIVAAGRPRPLRPDSWLVLRAEIEG